MVANPRPSVVRPVRLRAVAGADTLADRVARRGGRTFEAADVMGVALPSAHGGVRVLVPRGFGRPLLARGWAALGTGETCSPARWSDAGGVAAWVREARVPAGPSVAEPRGARPADGDGPVLCVRLCDVALAAARQADPTLRRGPVAVVDRWVRAASGPARARGVARGQSAAVARRRCPDVRVVAAPDPGPLRAAVVELLQTEVGDVGASALPLGDGGLLCVRLSRAERRSAAAFARAERVMRRLHQAFGLSVAAAVATEAADAQVLALQLAPGHVAFVPVEAVGAWRSFACRADARARPGGTRAQVRTSGRRAVWSGAPMPDIDGVAAMCGRLAERIEGPRLRVRIRGERGERLVVVAVPQDDASLRRSAAEAAARRAITAIGAVSSVIVSASRDTSATGRARSPAPARAARQSRGAPRPRATAPRTLVAPRQLALLPFPG